MNIPVPRHRRNHDAVQASRDLDVLARQITAAYEHLLRELNIADGQAAAQSFRDDGSAATGTDNATVRTTLVRIELTEAISGITEDLLTIHERTRSLAGRCRVAPSIRVPIDRCYSDPGLAGYLVPLDDGGWYDPMCTNPPRSNSGGQCDRCRKRHERWRARNGQPALPDERPTLYVVRIVEGELGTAHIDPEHAA